MFRWGVSVSVTVGAGDVAPGGFAWPIFTKPASALIASEANNSRWVPEGNLAAAIFRLEQPQTLEAVRDLINALELTTRGEDYRTIRRLLAIWLRAALKRNREYPILLPELDDLQELSVMLSQRMEQWAEAYIATGREEGLEKGLVQGLLKGEARMLGRQLTRRFGALPVWGEQRLNEATEAQLAAWSEAVLDADTLAGVFTEQPANH